MKSKQIHLGNAERGPKVKHCQRDLLLLNQRQQVFLPGNKSPKLNVSPQASQKWATKGKTWPLRHFANTFIKC